MVYGITVMIRGLVKPLRFYLLTVEQCELTLINHGSLLHIQCDDWSAEVISSTQVEHIQFSFSLIPEQIYRDLFERCLFVNILGEKSL